MFVLVSVAITGIFVVVNNLVPHLPQGAQSLVNFGLFLAFFWIPFEFIVRVIYRMSGVTRKLWGELPRLTHQQAETVNQYWIVWLVTALLTDAAYTLLFDRSHWKSSLLFGGAFALLILLSFVNRRFKIGGHSK